MPKLGTHVLRTAEERFFARFEPEPTSGCWLWTGSGNTYGTMRDDSRKMVGAHRWAWNYSRGSIPDGLQVLHRCDVMRCVNPGHLFLGTTQDNTADRHAKQRDARGERHGWSRFTLDDVRRIRASHLTTKTLSIIFCTWRRQINDIRNRRLWRHA